MLEISGTGATIELIKIPQTYILLSCPHLLRASMITAGENKSSTVIMDCRDEPGKDNGKSPSLWEVL
jgi:hypothetical protein